MGIQAKGTEMMEADKEANTENIYQAKVVIERVEEMMLPVEVLITFFDGHTILEKWDGKARSKTFFYERNVGVVSAQIDPEGKNYLDRDYLNNSYTYQANTTAVRKYVGNFMFWLQNIMQSMVALV